MRDTAPAATPGAPAARSGRSLLLVLGSCLVLSTAIVVPHVARYITLSPIDELQHIDYTVKASHFSLVRAGEKVGTTAMRAQSCRGIDAPGFDSPPCNAPKLSPEQFQEGGYDTAAIHPPTYYTLTGLGARAVSALTGTDFVTAARALGADWLAVGLFLTFLLSRALGSSVRAAVATTTFLAGLPVVILSSTTVTPDAAALLSGGIATLATVKFLQGRLGMLPLLAAGVAATAFKSTGILIVGLCFVLLVFTALQASTDEIDGVRRRYGWAAMVLALGGAAPVIAWTLLSGLTALDAPPSPMTRFSVDSLKPGQLLSNLFAFLPPTQTPYLAPVLRTDLVSALIVGAGLLVLAGVTVAALAGTQDRLVDRLGITTLGAMLLGGPFLVLLTFVVAHAYVEIPPRYGIVLLPPAVAVLAVVATRSRLGLIVVSVTAGLQLLALALAFG